MAEVSSKPLQGKRVMVTRALEQSERLVKALREQGAVAIVSPMVAFAPPDDPGALEELLRDTTHFDWLFLTSQNGLRALQEACEKLGIELAHRMRGVRVAVVGPATAERAREAQLSVEHEAARRYGTALAQELVGKIAGKKVLLPRSDKANPKLVAKLDALGAQVTEIVAYKTVPPEGQGLAKVEEVLRDGVDAVLFFSPSAVEHFQDILGEEKFRALSRQALFLAIGPITVQALRQAEVQRQVMARDVTVDAVIGALTGYFSGKGQKMPAGAKSE